MSTVASESPVVAGARWLARWFSRSWLFLVFFAVFFISWELMIDWFDVPRYILPKPSTIVIKSSADLDRLLYYTWVTGTETVLGYARGDHPGGAAGACHRVLALPAPGRSIRSSSASR